MNTIHTLVNRQPLKVTGSMRSPRGFFAAIVLLLALPIAVLCQMVFSIEIEIPLHFMLAISSVLMSLAVFDFKIPRWITWIGCVSTGALAAIFLLQAVSLLIQNDSLFYLAYQVLGQQLEASLIDVLIFWFVALLLLDSQGKTRIVGVVAVSLAVCYEVYRYILSYLGNEPAGILKLAILLPFVWLLFESKKKIALEVTNDNNLVPVQDGPLTT